jgi:serine/threonine protein kinase
MASLRGLSWRYAAPEVIQSFKSVNFYQNLLILKAGDIYAFAMIIYELLCAIGPWSQSPLKLRHPG